MSSGIQGLANMELKICSAFIKAATAKVDAKSLIQSVSNEINKQYSLHATQLFTQADGVIFQSEMMEVKTDVSKAIAKPQLWMINAILTAILVYMACEDPATTSREKSVLPVNSRTGQQMAWPKVSSPTRRGGLDQD